MKLQVTYDASSTFNKKEPRRITIEGNEPVSLNILVDEFIKPLLIALGYTVSLIDDYFGE